MMDSFKFTWWHRCRILAASVLSNNFLCIMCGDTQYRTSVLASCQETNTDILYWVCLHKTYSRILVWRHFFLPLQNQSSIYIRIFYCHFYPKKDASTHIGSPYIFSVASLVCVAVAIYCCIIVVCITSYLSCTENQYNLGYWVDPLLIPIRYISSISANFTPTVTPFISWKKSSISYPINPWSCMQITTTYTGVFPVWFAVIMIMW